MQFSPIPTTFKAGSIQSGTVFVNCLDDFSFPPPFLPFFSPFSFSSSLSFSSVSSVWLWNSCETLFVSVCFPFRVFSFLSYRFNVIVLCVEHRHAFQTQKDRKGIGSNVTPSRPPPSLVVTNQLGLLTYPSLVSLYNAKQNICIFLTFPSFLYKKKKIYVSEPWEMSYLATYSWI